MHSLKKSILCRFTLLALLLGFPFISSQDEEHLSRSIGLDFIIGGFSKCATSSIVKLLDSHEEIQMVYKEKLDKNGKMTRTEYVVKGPVDGEHLYEQLAKTRPEETNIKRGIKWPTAIVHSHVRSIKFFRDKNPSGRQKMKIIIGMRNPIRWFESLYNYRIREIIDGKRANDTIPLPYDLIGGREKAWRQINTDAARFEFPIMQLGKVDLSIEEVAKLAKRGEQMIQTHGMKIFFYLQDQLDDPNVASTILEDLRVFLELSSPFPKDIPKGHDHLKNTFDICDSLYAPLRHVMLDNAKETSNWIQSKLMDGAKDVTFAARENFMSIVKTWGEDPCVTTS